MNSLESLHNVERDVFYKQLSFHTFMFLRRREVQITIYFIIIILRLSSNFWIRFRSGRRIIHDLILLLLLPSSSISSPKQRPRRRKQWNPTKPATSLLHQYSIIIDELLLLQNLHKGLWSCFKFSANSKTGNVFHFLLHCKV